MKILILYSTMMGTTELVATTIQKNLIASGNSADIRNVYDFANVHFSGYDMLIFGAPTYDEKLERSMERFISQTTSDLSQYKIAVFGLGDKTYSHYCTSVEAVEKWVLENAGELIIQSLRIDGYPISTDFIDAWAAQIHASSENQVI